MHDLALLSASIVESLRDVGPNPLVLWLHPSGEELALELAKALGGDSDVALIVPLAAAEPQPRLGWVDERGHAYVDNGATQLGSSLLFTLRGVAVARLRDLRAKLTPGRAALDPRGRNVVLVDEGVRDGATLAAALRAIRARRPRMLVAALTHPAVQAERLRLYADRLLVISRTAGEDPAAA